MLMVRECTTTRLSGSAFLGSAVLPKGKPQTPMTEVRATRGSTAMR